MSNLQRIQLGGDEPETCLHCKLGNLVRETLLKDGLYGADELIGALIGCAGQVISQAPDRATRRKVLKQAVELLREESRPDPGELEHLH